METHNTCWKRNERPGAVMPDECDQAMPAPEHEQLLPQV